MRQSLLKSLFAIAMLVFSTGVVFSQGVTTSGLNGRVTDATGETLPGANVVAVHLPSGSRYGAVTNQEGRYSIPGMRVGGPYTITVSFIGFETAGYENVYLSLGQTQSINVELRDDASDLDEFVVTSVRDQIFDGNRTGASISVNSDAINSLPTISRSIQDYARLSPLASTRGSGISFAGSNNRYNQFSIDGTVNNDVFGLAASGTNGGQTGTQPISLDAIEEINVEIAPFDVRMGGFTGGGINAVTRSGTNEIKGSAYYFVNNQSLTGTGVLEDTEGQRVPDYSERQYGFRVGGPIIKNKLFFFANAELTERTQPKLFGIGEGSNLTQAEVDQVLSVINRIAPGADVGNANRFNEEDKTQKFFLRLDWNINDKNKFSIRHNYVNSESLSIFRNANTFVLSGGAQFFPSTTNTTVAELNTRFSNSVANELRLGYTTVRDDRGYVGDPFPFVRVDFGNRNIQLGSEQFGTANTLNQDVFTLTNNLSIYKGKHTITLGTHNEFYSIYNLFIRQAFGSYRYASLDDWLTVGTPNEAFPLTYDYSFSNVPGQPNWGAEFGAAQIGFYAQDEYQASDNLRLTFGVRGDLPVFFDQPTANETFNNSLAATRYGVRTDVIPSSNILWSPRVGFNWDVNGDQTFQVRGGAGIFSGRLPFVWLSNQYSNTGIEIARLQAQRSQNQFPANFTFNPNPFTQPNASDLGLPTFTSEINVTDPKFKYPQVFRLNLGTDYKFDNGVIVTLDGIYTKNYNNILYQNLNIAGLEDFNFTQFQGADNRQRFNGARINPDFTDIIYLTNTNEGYSYNLSAQVSKRWENGFYANIGYNHGVSKDINPGTSSQAVSNFRGVPTFGNPNNPELSFSNFMVPHRLIGTLTYRKEYAGFLATSVGIFYNGQSGLGQSFVYNGDMNRDGVLGNDLIFVPGQRSDILLYDRYALSNGQWVLQASADQQYNDLMAFIDNDSYLSGRKGQYAERNGGRTPFEHRFDIRVAQEFFTKSAGKLEFTLDVLNFGNMLNSNWGRSYNANNSQPVSVASFGSQSGGEPRTINGTVTPVPTDRPAYKSFVSGSDETFAVNDFFSRWRAQFGIRYTF
ncbi:carboxypeptidase regulatory-like domain-containing protein [Belliella kenyensis]|uniref:Carboxypeptidase regulatory-like domain-containing protein n=1 Tax=Belliella kenyensis TaxID=1472724 RepID=A0ABV8EHL6_9BACT|nr:TonB-dependent receptor [Belliella kenyensis]MCH7403680.1 TonB-dependent receptor [Belliella kenyensis]MDN3603447.1 TonB-dependent receptor [Belliella kenyensis]